MDIDFSFLLFVLVLVSGAVWLFDAAFLARFRRRRTDAFLKEKKITAEEIKSWEQTEKMDQARRKILDQAARLGREPVPVEYAKSFFPVLFAVLVIRSFLFEPFQIPTGSMIPTLNVGDFIVVNKFAYGIRLPVIGTKVVDVDEPKRGDIMVFIPPHDPSYFIKRVVGLPGDHVRYDEKEKTVYINGKPAEQEFVALLRDHAPPTVYLREQLGRVEHDIYTASTPRFLGPGYWLPPEGRMIPDGHYFMMGDNRDNSDDSRRWGPVSEDSIIGKAVAVWMHKEPGLNLPTFGENRLLNRAQASSE